jgi:multidrug efflux pump subunit AcrA (membrane-fusion protein)
MTSRYLLFVISFLVISCGQKKEFVQPTIEKITESVYASGTVKSAGQYQVFSKTSGILKSELVTEGDLVQKGQILFTLSNDVSRLNTDNAQLLANNADIRTNTDKLRELSLTIELSKKKMQSDELTMSRQRKLWADQIGTKYELEQRELAYANSKSAYESALLRYNDLKKQLNFSSQQTKKSLSISQSLMDDFNVRCEAAGKVYAILKEKGEMISPQMPLAIVGNGSQFSLYLQIDENDIASVALGQKVLITMDSYKGKLFEAVITKINPLMNEKSRSFEVEASFTKQPKVLYPNLTVEANIILQTKENALTIPRNYLIDDEFILLADNKKKKVKVGLKDFQKAEIVEGLNKEDKIYLPQ